MSRGGGVDRMVEVVSGVRLIMHVLLFERSMIQRCQNQAAVVGVVALLLLHDYTTVTSTYQRLEGFLTSTLGRFFNDDRIDMNKHIFLDW